MWRMDDEPAGGAERAQQTLAPSRQRPSRGEIVQDIAGDHDVKLRGGVQREYIADREPQIRERQPFRDPLANAEETVAGVQRSHIQPWIAGSQMDRHGAVPAAHVEKAERLPLLNQRSERLEKP